MRLSFRAALVAAASLTALPAQAQEEELVVTATRAPTPAQRLPARVEVIGRDTIEQRSLVALPEALGSAAVQGGGAGQQASVFLRGTNSKHVLALFDGIRLNDAAAPNAAYDFGQDTLGGLQRIEVVRGPMSALYGSDAIGGVVNLIPRRGGATGFEPFLEFGIGSHDARYALLGAAGSADGWDYGLSAESFATDGFDATPERMTTHTGDPDGADITTFMASIRGVFGGVGVDALVRSRTSGAEYDTFSGGVFFDLRADDPDLENEATQNLWRVGADWTRGAFMVRLSGGQVTSDRRETDGGFQTSSSDSERRFADLTAHWRTGSSAVTAGVAFERNAIDTVPQFASPLSIEEEHAAAYLAGQFDLSSWLTATGSVRVDDYDAFGAQTTYSLGAVAHFDAFRVYASYGTAFKAPSLSERFELGFFNIGNPDLAPEESESWEIGADWAANDAFRVGVSYYQTRIDDLIEYSFAQLQNINVGRAEIDGAELFVELAATDWLSFGVSHAWTDARNGLNGAQLARRPEHAWRAEAILTPSERLSLTLSWGYAGDRTDVTYDDGGNFLNSAGRVSSFNVGTIAATYDLSDQAQLFLRVDNVTDETYEEPAAFAGAPRAGLLGLRARF